MDLYHISWFLSSGSSHSWVNLERSEWETTANICFAQIIEENLTTMLSRLKKKKRRKQQCENDNGRQERTTSNLLSLLYTLHWKHLR